MVPPSRYLVVAFITMLLCPIQSNCILLHSFALCNNGYSEFYYQYYQNCLIVDQAFGLSLLLLPFSRQLLAIQHIEPQCVLGVSLPPSLPSYSCIEFQVLVSARCRFTLSKLWKLCLFNSSLSKQGVKISLTTSYIRTLTLMSGSSPETN